MGDGLISQTEIDSILNSLGSTGGSSSSDAGGIMDAFSGLGGGSSGDSSGGGGGTKTASAGKTKENIDTENIPLLLDVKMKLSVVLGNSRRSIRDVLDLGKGSVVELNRFVEDDVDVYINDQLIGKGQIVAIDDEYGIRITKILEPVKKIDFKK